MDVRSSEGPESAGIRMADTGGIDLLRETVAKDSSAEAVTKVVDVGSPVGGETAEDISSTRVEAVSFRGYMV